jgi:hypothetical protein
MNVLFLLSVLCLTITQSKSESLKLPSEKSLKTCFIEKGLGHFAKRSHLIDMYAGQNMSLSSFNEVISVAMHVYAHSIKETPKIKYITTLRKEEIMNCMLQDVPKDDIERVKIIIKESTCE